MKCTHLVQFAAILIAAVISMPAPLRATDLEDLKAPGAKVEKLLGDMIFTEGPAYSPDGFLVFTDPKESRILRYNLDGTSSVFLTPTGMANGLMFDAEGNLYACCGGSRQVNKIRPQDKKMELIVDSYDGKKLNSPNDIALDGQGGLYFTDPRYGRRDGVEQSVEGVYYVDSKGKISRVVDDLERPNGILVSQDGKTLYVADHAAAKIMQYRIEKPGQLSEGKVLFTGDPKLDGRGPDGMSIDTNGNLYGTYSSLVVLSPDGTLIGRIKFPENPSNCTFGGPDNRTLFITARTSLYSLKMQVEGIPLKASGPAGGKVVTQTISFSRLKEDAKEKDAETKPVKIEDITLDVPTSWKMPAPASSMRLANFEIPAAEGDKEPAELTISFFKGTGGGIDANVKRWVDQFASDGREVTAKSGTSPQGKYVLVDLTGTYRKSVGAPIAGRTEPMPDYRALNVILTVKDKGNYFLKLTGPEKTVTAAAEAFRKSFDADKKSEKDYDL